jgi:DNA-binding GntR family transcriptional regulator
VDQVVQAIREGIQNGRFVPGQRLIESDLTEQFGISRGPLREAMSRLAGDSLVVIEPHKGVAVRRFTQEELEDLYDVRQAVESLAARLAAARIDRNDNRSRLQALVTEMQAFSNSGDVIAYASCNDRFHKLIVEISGNRYLTNLVEHLHVPIFRELSMRFMDAGARQESIADHHAIAQAIFDGAGARAESAMSEHVQRSKALMGPLAGQLSR